MPSKEQVDAFVAQGVDYPEIGRRLGVPAGQAFLIHTGMPADGHRSTDRPTGRPDVPTDAQDLTNPPHENPTSRDTVHAWIAGRVAADEQMRRAGAAAKAAKNAAENAAAQQGEQE